MQKEEGRRDLGCVHTMRERPDGQMVIRVTLFVLPEELDLRASDVMYDGREVFWSDRKEDVSPNSIDGFATVLGPEDWKRAREAGQLNELDDRIHVCGRRIKVGRGL